MEHFACKVCCHRRGPCMTGAKQMSGPVCEVCPKYGRHLFHIICLQFVNPERARDRRADGSEGNCNESGAKNTPGDAAKTLRSVVATVKSAAATSTQRTRDGGRCRQIASSFDLHAACGGSRRCCFFCAP